MVLKCRKIDKPRQTFFYIYSGYEVQNTFSHKNV